MLPPRTEKPDKEENNMDRIYQGKTKDVYRAEDGNYVLAFKDDVTGENGVFDPGANTVGFAMEGAGRAGLRLSCFFFEKIAQAGIPTHFVSADIDRATMTVKPAKMFGEGVEVIVRYRAVGSFFRRYARYCREGDPLDAYVEVTLKDDERNDPLITADALEMLGIMDRQEYDELAGLAARTGEVVRAGLAEKGLELYDIKFEFGRIGKDGQVALIDEISGGNMRAYRDGERVEPLELARILLGD